MSSHSPPPTTLASLPAEVLGEIVRFVLDDGRYHSVASLHAASRHFRGLGIIEALAKEVFLAKRTPWQYYRDARPDAPTWVGRLYKLTKPTDVVFMGPEGRSRAAKVSRCTSTVAYGLKYHGRGRYRLVDSIDHIGGSRPGILLVNEANGTPCLRVTRFRESTFGYRDFGWMVVECSGDEMCQEDMAVAIEALCENHHILSDYPEQNALPLDHALCYELDASEAEALAGAVFGAATTAGAAENVAPPRFEVRFETRRYRGMDPNQSHRRLRLGPGFIATSFELRCVGSAELDAPLALAKLEYKEPPILIDDRGAAVFRGARFTGGGDDTPGGPIITGLIVSPEAGSRKAQDAVMRALLAEVEGVAEHAFPAFGLRIEILQPSSLLYDGDRDDGRQFASMFPEIFAHDPAETPGLAHHCFSGWRTCDSKLLGQMGFQPYTNTADCANDYPQMTQCPHWSKRLFDVHEE